MKHESLDNGDSANKERNSCDCYKEEKEDASMAKSDSTGKEANNGSGNDDIQIVEPIFTTKQPVKELPAVPPKEIKHRGYMDSDTHLECENFSSICKVLKNKKTDKYVLSQL